MSRWLVLSVALSSAACAIGGGVEPLPVASADAQEGGGVLGQWVRSGGIDRRYQLFVPDGQDGHTPLPLVVVLHGAGGSGATIRLNLDMDAAAARHGFVAAYPYGVGSWAIGLGTMADGYGVNDVLFVRTLIAQLASELPIDRRRVYVVGFSDGATMSYRLGCQLGDEIAAIAAISSGMPSFPQLYGRPSRPLPVLMVAGTADEIFPLSSVSTTAQEWARLDGCRSQTTESLDGLSAEGRAIQLTRYDGCNDEVGVRLYLIEGGRHTTAIPLNGTTPADLVLDFFEQHDKPR
jgi:polyhydroxybutyrate depolymerase